MIITTCGHEVSGGWFLSQAGHVPVRGLDRRGERAVKYVMLCPECLKKCKEESVVLTDEQAKVNWIEDGKGKVF